MIRSALLAALLLAPLAAYAKPAATDSVAGTWSWKGSEFNGCVVTGTLTVGPPAAKRSCAINAVQTCGRNVYRARQTCTIAVTGSQVTINSKIVSAPPDYQPDNFTLTQESAQRMTGTLSSPPYGSLTAVFWRGTDMIS